MTDRERLGLPDRFQATDLQGAVEAEVARLHASPVDRLLAVLGDAGELLSTRIAAGNLLALAGDPRLDPLAPEMLSIPGGVVEIGLPEYEIDTAAARLAHLGIDRGWIAKEAPRHAVTLAPYLMARYPVTNGEFRQFLIETGHGEIPSSWAFRRYPAERANHPVYTVSAASADAYAAWAAARANRAFRLPTEAEWEFAAAGPDGREYPWGQCFDPALANTAECGLLDTSPVGAFLGGESPFGVADMGGNVEEYVADVYAPYPGGELIADHLVQIHGTYRIARGGGFSRFSDLARTRRRHGHNPRSATYAMGFRLAESLV
jgi:formylglycine-generating enzyme required for sulfatase activity